MAVTLSASGGGRIIPRHLRKIPAGPPPFPLPPTGTNSSVATTNVENSPLGLHASEADGGRARAKSLDSQTAILYLTSVSFSRLMPREFVLGLFGFPTHLTSLGT